ncbi:MAG: Fis family transcriptional regulator [Gammaproteobacteria bacterium SG8_11]|nr:MAG: Fis family transcriptional regulator [Gammaproteobacteria bacterium SG8_11]
MTITNRLSSEDREFFRKLATIIFSNPFSIDPTLIEELLGKKLASFSPTQTDKYLPLVPILEQRLSRLESRGIQRIQSVHADDRKALEYAYLFLYFHKYLHAIDELIQNQLAAGQEPVAVPFHAELVHDLKSKGFTTAESHRFLALFYQLRRAFYFIVQALVGDSPSMVRLRHGLWNNVFTSDVRLYADHLWDRMEDFSTLLLGETGTGKGTAAAAIGRSGLIPFNAKTGRFERSFTETFIAINLSEFPETLIESELFGHRKGAFTGAIDHHKGLFERCSAQGSLFLDEIGDVSIPTQIKLLNVIQERRFSPVGSHEVKRFEGRVIAATNQSIYELRKQGKFRDDFYYRLSSDVVEVPPLRVRLQEAPGELKQIVRLLISRMLGTKENAELVANVLSKLTNSLPRHYPWPGNVRELEQAVRKIIINNEFSDQSTTEMLTKDWLDDMKQGQLSAQELLSHYCYMLYSRFGTYEEVAEKTALDRRTVKKYIDSRKQISKIGK